MTEDNQNEIIDLDFDMGDVNIERPVFKDQIVDLVCIKTIKKPSKSTPGNNNLDVEFKSTSPLETTDGKTFPPGQVLFDSMPLQDSGKMTAGQWRERPTKLHFALTGDKSGKISTGLWQGKTVKAKLKVRPERTDEKSGETYPPKHEISFYYPPTAA